MKKTIIVVDDERTFKSDDEIIYFRTQDEALSGIVKIWTKWYMSYGSPIDELWLDHDLGPDSGDAAEIAEFLKAFDNAWNLSGFIKNIYVHSQNPVGADNLMGLLDIFNPTRVPLPELV